MNELTPRERSIAELVCEGRTDEEIGRQLWISTHAVKTHLASMYRKTGTRNRVSLAVKYGEAKIRQELCGQPWEHCGMSLHMPYCPQCGVSRNRVYQAAAAA